MGQIVLFLIGCLVGWFWVSLFFTYRQRKQCDDGWEFAALVIANMLTTARIVWDGVKHFALLAWTFLCAVYARIREAHKRLQAKGKVSE
jgi:hypothetical protein